MSILKITNINYKNILNNLSLNIEENKFITISGANNSGKTTLMRIINREFPDTFDIEILGKKLNDYNTEELARTIQCVIPNNIYFIETNLYEEMNYNCNSNASYIDYICKGLKIKRIVNNNYNTYNQQELILSQLAIALSIQPKILLIDNISPYFNKKDIENIIIFLKEYQKKYNITIIYTTINLEESILTDYIYIINDGKIELSGIPIEVLQKDNIINKIGLNIPFMIDLSVKLRDYDLIKEIETDKDRMVEMLWK